MKHSEKTAKKTVVIGASPNTDRYAAMAVKQLTVKGNEAVPVGITNGTVHGIPILTGNPPVSNVHTVTLYVNPSIQQTLYKYILSLKPERIIFNPGAENPEFEEMAKKQGIETLEACTLVMLSVGAF